MVKKGGLVSKFNFKEDFMSNQDQILNLDDLFLAYYIFDQSTSLYKKGNSVLAQF